MVAILFILIQIVSCKETIKLLDGIVDQNYITVQCMNNIFTKSFPCGKLAEFVNPNEHVNNFIKVNNEDNPCHSVLIRSSENCNWYAWTNVYVITAQDFTDLSNLMEVITREVFWNPRAHFVIQESSISSDEDLRKIFELLLKYNIYRIVLLHTLENNGMIYTYKPFDNGNCGNNFDDIITIGTCENDSNITTYFPNVIPKTVNNCSLGVVANEDVPNFITKSSNYTVYGKYVPGVEQYVLETIAPRLGFYVEYKPFESHMHYGEVLPDLSTTGLLNYIDNRKAEVAAGGYALTSNRVQLFDYLWGFNYAAFNLYTPTLGTQLWKRVYKEFGKLTWYLIVIVIGFVISVCLIVKRLLNDKTFSFLNLWGYFFGNSNKGLSKHKKFRMVILSWSWFTFFVTNFYNTALVSLVSIHVHETPHSSSVDNLKTLSYKPCISDDTRAFYMYAFNHRLPKAENHLNCSFQDASLKYAAMTKQYYAIEMEYTYKLKEYMYVDNDDKPLLDSWVFSNTHALVMYLTRGFPYKDRFQFYASRMYEAGLTNKHLNTIYTRSYKALQRHTKEFTKTTISDLSLHFYVLFVGYVVSFLCFMLEIWYNYILNERKSKIKVLRRL